GPEAGEEFLATGVQGLAVDGEGDLWAYQGNGQVSRFDGKGTSFLNELGVNAGLALDEEGHVALVTGGATERFSTAGVDEGQLDEFGYALAADPVSHHVFVDHAGFVNEFDAAKSKVREFGANAMFCSQGIAVLHSADRVYVSEPCSGAVEVFE